MSLPPTLVLRPVVEADLPVLERLAGPEAAWNWTGWTPAAQVRETFARDGFLSERSSTLVVDADGTAVGTVSWGPRHWSTPPHSQSWEVGITLLPEHRGKGHGSAAQRALVDHLFLTTRQVRVEAVTNAGNVAEQRALLAAGFVLEGVLRDAEWREGRHTDVHLYARLRSDWEAGAAPGRA